MHVPFAIAVIISSIAAVVAIAAGASVRRLRVRLAETRRLLALAEITDGDTGVYNRRHLLERFGQELQKARRLGSPLCCVAVEIDDFTQLVERFGHEAGGRLLRQFADICRSSARMYDIPGRYDGEEVLIVLPDTDALGASNVAERIRQSIAGDLVINTGTCNIFVSISAGIAELGPADDGIDDIIRRAHEALASARNSGKNRIVRAR